MRLFFNRLNIFFCFFAALGLAVLCASDASVPITIPPIMTALATGIAVFVASFTFIFVVTVTFWDLIFSRTRREIFVEGLKETWWLGAILGILCGLGAGWYAGEYFILPGMITGYLLVSIGTYFWASLQLGGLPEYADEMRKIEEASQDR